MCQLFNFQNFYFALFCNPLITPTKMTIIIPLMLVLRSGSSHTPSIEPMNYFYNMYLSGLISFYHPCTIITFLGLKYRSLTFFSNLRKFGCSLISSEVVLVSEEAAFCLGPQCCF